jgi:hypothetical protein
MRIKCVVNDVSHLRLNKVDIDGSGVPDPGITMLTAGTVVRFHLLFNSLTENLMSSQIALRIR